MKGTYLFGSHKYGKSHICTGDTDAFGQKLDGLLRARRGELFGI